MIKDVQANGEAVSPQKRTFQQIKIWNFWIFSNFCGSFFARLDPDQVDQNQCGSGSATLVFYLQWARPEWRICSEVDSHICAAEQGFGTVHLKNARLCCNGCFLLLSSILYQKTHIFLIFYIKKRSNFCVSRLCRKTKSYRKIFFF